MKNIFKYTLALSFVAILGSCTVGFEDLNKDPNKITIGGVEPSGLIEPMLKTGTDALSSAMTTYGTEIAQMTGQTTNPREEQAYKIQNQDWEGRWNACYKWANNANHMSELAKAQGDANYEAIGVIMKVYYLQICTDLFGSIAYTEAFKGSQQVMQPRIQPQKEVYEAMMADLEYANGLLNTSKTLSKGERDLLYRGNIANWKKFANTLHLRILMRVSGRNTAFSPTVAERIATIVNDPNKYPVFVSNTDNASVKCSGSAPYYRNPFNPSDIPGQSSFNDAKLSVQLIDMMVYDYNTGDCDPRLKIWGKPAPGNNYLWKGCVPAGDFNKRSINNPKTASRHYETIVREDNPSMMMDYAELLFIKAEAAFNGWIGGSAKDYYEQAIKASCERWNEIGKYAKFPDQSGKESAVNIAAKDIAAMLDQPKTEYNNTLQRIQEQKWLSLFWVVGLEPYAEMRRTGYPDVKLGQMVFDRNFTDGKFIARWGYPNVAIAKNRANYSAAYQEQGGNPSVSKDMNDMTLPVWWSGQAVSKDSGSAWPHSFRTQPTMYVE